MLKATDENTTVYYTRGFELISRREGTTASYYVYDGGLSVRALTNEAGTVTDTLVFDAFGNETGRTGTTDNPYGFQGEEQDATGLYYLRARYMDPATGTFTTMDTYGGSLSDPMSLHKYLFANSNPVMYSDPSGHFTTTEQLLICALIGEITSSVLYYVELFTTDNIQYENPKDYILGGAKAALTGLLMGVFMCLFYMAFVYITTAYIATVIFGVSGLFMAGFGMLEGTDDIENGDSALGWTKIVINALAAALCVFSLINGTIAEHSSNAGNGTVNDNSDHDKPNFSNNTTPDKEKAINDILNGERIGSGLQDNATHRAASFLSEEHLRSGHVYCVIGKDGNTYTLLQTKGQLNGVDGVFEYLINDAGQVTHQRFIAGGGYTGFTNQHPPKRG